MKSSESGMCIDSMEKPVGSDTQLFGCHGQEGNQVIFYINEWLKAYIYLRKIARYLRFDPKMLLCIY